jgi:hypothetical protein
MPSQTPPKILRVWPENVTPLWPQIAPMLEPALAISSTHTPEHVRRAVMVGKAHLWAQMDDTIVEACMVTEFADFPIGMFVRVWSAGARIDRRMDTDAFVAAATDWALKHGCIGLEAVGRAGWLRRVPNSRVEGLIMRVVF